MSENLPQKRKRGRPRKSEVEAKTAGKRGKVGRPKGDTAILNEYKARMLASPKSAAVLQKVLDTALEDGHPHQGACMKMVWDKLLPSSYFEKDKLSQGRGQIEININVEQPASVDTVVPDDAVDADFERVHDE